MIIPRIPLQPASSKLINAFSVSANFGDAPTPLAISSPVPPQLLALSSKTSDARQLADEPAFLDRPCLRQPQSHAHQPGAAGRPRAVTSCCCRGQSVVRFPQRLRISLLHRAVVFSHDEPSPASLHRKPIFLSVPSHGKAARHAFLCRRRRSFLSDDMRKISDQQVGRQPPPLIIERP